MLLSGSVAQASPLLLLILLRFRDNHVIKEVCDPVEGVCDVSACNELALDCLSFLMMNIPEACNLISKSLLDTSSVIYTHSIECRYDHLVAVALPFDDLVEPASAALFEIERQNSIQAFCESFGDRQKGMTVFRALECIKVSAAATNDPAQVAVQLVSSLIDFMLRNIRSSGATSRTDHNSALLCIDMLLDEHSLLSPSVSFCLIDPVAAWLHSLACSNEINWLLVSTACSLWCAAAASVASKSNHSLFEFQTNDSGASASLELAALALRRIVSMQPPEFVVSIVVAACDSSTAAFRAISTTASFAGISFSHGPNENENIIDLATQCEQSLPLHVRCGSLLRLQNMLLDCWQDLKPESQGTVLHAVQTCLFDAAASVYVAAVEVLCSIGKVDPSSVFSFGSKFLSSNSVESIASCGDGCGVKNKENPRHIKDLKETPASLRDLALCKVFDALGDAVGWLLALSVIPLHISIPYMQEIRTHAHVFRCRPHHPF